MKVLNVQQCNTITKCGHTACGQGLYLWVSSTGTRSWVSRITVDSKRVWKVIGDASPNGMRLAEARALVGKVKTESSSAPTFKKIAEDYISAREESKYWSNPKHAQQWRNTLTEYAYPTIGHKQPHEVTPSDVLSILKNIGSKLETARRVRSRIENILDAGFAVYYQNQVIANPASVKVVNHLSPNLGIKRSKEHHAALAVKAAPALYKGITSKRLITSYNALRFIILTACRSNNARQLTWSQLDMKKKLWTVPADLMKARNEWRCPLSGETLELLKDQKVLNKHLETDIVFPNSEGGALSDVAISKSLHRVKGGEDVTVHGMRSCFRDWSASAGYSFEVAESQLAHSLGTKTVTAYLRSDFLAERKPMMTAWAEYLRGAK
ncbi:site-specific integrase [Polynucleobacter sp. es-MAR-4]|uniref:tyrosine-type recombinase/integrase n=1 Tax=Polynucleobacter sp. es-MAR-4 TaxID=1855655 RepID=UPI001C0BED95|nr:site-specific integrase [Polynucleobacter sp. es-MAR-4]MBU3637376.1 tyrosine-type recombinase/integrase [Polynucleobacter sp. es-MAR-4]